MESNFPAQISPGHLDSIKVSEALRANPHTTASSQSSIELTNQESCKCLGWFHTVLRRSFRRLGRHIARNPRFYIVIPIFLTALAATGIQRMNYLADPEYLFSPKEGEGKSEREVIERLFPIDYNHKFDPSRITRISHFSRLLITAKDNDTMLRTNIWDDVLALDEAVRNISIEYDSETYYYEDVCAKWNEECIENKVFNLNDIMHEIENRSIWLNYPVMLYPLVLPFFFGGPTVNESEGVLIAADSIALTYWFSDADHKYKQRSHMYEGKILEMLDKTDFNTINVARYVSRTLEDELENNTNSMIPYVIVTIGLMIGFSILSVMMADWVRSKVYLGFCGVLCAAMATVCSFGTLMYIGVPFIGINVAAPFLMLGIGIDDMFVLLSAWHRTRIQDPIECRLSETYSEAAVSITITSLTNMLSFLIGSFTPFPSVQIFCLYTGFSILLTYIWFITCFGGCLAVSGYMEAQQKHALSCKSVRSVSKAKEEGFGCCYNLWCSGGINPQDPWNPKDNRPHIIMLFFRNYVGKTLNYKPIKALVIFIFMGYLGGALYGCTRVQEGLERRRLAHDYSYSIEFFDMEDKMYRKFPYRLQVVVQGNLTYSEPETKKMLLDLHESFENMSYVGPRFYTESWIRSFYRLLDRRPHIKENITDEASFIVALKKELAKLNSAEKLDVVFNEDETRIVASRFIIQSYMVEDTNADKDMMQAVRKVAASAPVPMEVICYHAFFVFFDQFLLVRTVSIQAISLAAVVMMFVSLIFIPNPWCSLWVAFSIISIEVGVVGYMSLWGVSLDSISMINLIMCIGFSVDFSAHISYAFLTAKVSSPDERVRECLYNLGLPVVQGGFSTIIGVIALTFAPSYIFQTFFKIVFLVVFFGIMHGILLLPVMLSLLGPGSFKRRESQIKRDRQSLDEELHIQDICGITMSKSNENIRHVHGLSHGLALEHKDTDSMDRDLGLGSSGEESSQSSLNNVECIVTDRSHRRNSSKKSSRSSLGFSNEAFQEENEENEHL